MCGIVAVYGNIDAKVRKAFDLMLQLDTIRGPDSTGIATINSDGSVNVDKWVGTPWQSGIKYQKHHQGAVSGIIGHNRWATVGEVTEDNAHPFTHFHITGVHNGTLTSRYKLDKYTDFKVDSENLYYHMANNSVQDTLHKVLGAYALVWYDDVDRTLNYLRNSDRPLYLATTVDKKTVFLASESWMITVACAKSGILVNDPVLIPVMTHFCVSKVDNNLVTVETEVEGWKNTHVGKPFLGGYYKDLDDREVQYANKGGRFVSAGEWYQELCSGCGVCGMIPKYGKKVTWLHGFNPAEYICHDCVDTDFARQYLKLN